MSETLSLTRDTQEQFDEISSLVSKIKTKLRAQQVKGTKVPDELLFLMSRLNHQEMKIWWNIRKIEVADQNFYPLLDETKKQIMGFRKSCARAMALLPTD